MTWHIVVSQGNIILGVFGEALFMDAHKCATRVTAEIGQPAWIAKIIGERPRVGQISPIKYFKNNK